MGTKANSTRFGYWLFEKPSRILAWSGAIIASFTTAFLSNAARLFSHAEASFALWLTQNAKAVGYGLQTVVILVLTVLAARAFRKQFRPGHRASIAVAQFRTVWVCFWITMGLVYAVHLAREVGVGGSSSTKFDVADALVGYLANMFLFFLYVILRKITVAPDARAQPSPFIGWIGLTVLLVLFRIYCVLEASNSVLSRVSDWLDAITGTLAFAMLVGRMESIYIGGPSAIVAILYVYAAMQMSQIAEGGSGYQESVKPVLAAVALPLKLTFFVFVQWTIATGRLVFYMARVRDLLGSVDGEREQFLKRVTQPAISLMVPNEVTVTRGAIAEASVRLVLAGAEGRVRVVLADLPKGVSKVAEREEGEVWTFQLLASELGRVVARHSANVVATDDGGNAANTKLSITVL